ncbi:hypothetical protein NTD84_20855 [Pseudomonas sp. 14P_8.1_Bac3]|uniref:hypothetical protein n=1 Tax=Pseudomonas sp. 14P_8.1_Bac3 TaxID=2971621 RepID=UPI0021C5D2C4|nr:hypothetical protein [Pseudomonas sp. 14P_8.1_Bac3]MCU1762158.1 hypothetical protein [Pseudomonas sp. 14P_8.1_Bac3]
MIIGDPYVFEIGDPVVDQYATERCVGIVIDIEQNDGGETVLVVESDTPSGEMWRILDKNAVLP